jgi:putative MATE family efflux protein
MSQSRPLKDMSAQYARRGNLIDGPIGPLLFKMAAPMTWGIFASISFQLVDLFYIGLLGTETLAAISFTLPVTLAVFSLVLGLGIGCSSVLSRKIGAGDHQDVRRLTIHALILGAIIGGFLTILGLACSDNLFTAMGASDTMRPIIHDYMNIWLLTIPFIALPLIGNAILRAHGKAIIPAYLMTGGAIANVILSPIMIFGFMGVPAMGVAGAAGATLIINILTVLALLYILLRGKFFNIQSMSFDQFKNSAKQILMIALPAGLTNMVTPVATGIITGLLAQHSTQAVAAFGIASRIEAFAFIVIMGLAGGMAPIIGQNWGASLFERVRDTLQHAFRFNIYWSFFICAIMALFAAPIASIFSNDPDVIQLAQYYFWIVPVSYAAGNLVPGWASAFNAMGAPERAALMILIKSFIIMIPACYIGSHFAGYVGIVCAISLTNLLVGSTLHAYGWHQFKNWTNQRRLAAA